MIDMVSQAADIIKRFDIMLFHQSMIEDVVSSLIGEGMEWGFDSLYTLHHDVIMVIGNFRVGREEGFIYIFDSCTVSELERID